MLIPSVDLTTFELGSLENGLVLDCPLDDATGLTADKSGNAFDGTVVNATRGNTGGHLGNYFGYDGTGDYVTHYQAALAALFASGSAFAYSEWVRASSFGVDMASFSIGDGSGNNLWALYPFYNPGGMEGVNSVYCWMNGSFIMTPASSHAADGSTWVNVIYNQDSATSREILVDGSSIGTDTSNNSFVAGVDAVTDGAYGTTQVEEFIGEKSHRRLWNRGLTAEEIARLQLER